MSNWRILKIDYKNYAILSACIQNRRKNNFYKPNITKLL